jgi:thioredoxin reductase (NADPH)
MESQLCGDEEVIIIGGGNSAGQAAVFLAQTARHVNILVRSRGLGDTWLRYVIRRIEANPVITVRTETEFVELDGDSGSMKRVASAVGEGAAAIALVHRALRG